jgi:hypothetical protein
MKSITRRTLSMRHGVEGPREDPYSRVEYEFEETRNRHARRVRLVCGLRTRLYFNDREVTAPRRLSRHRYSFKKPTGWVDPEAWLIRKFETFSGMTLDQFEKAYNRIHPWFNDPMGSPSMYE